MASFDGAPNIADLLQVEHSIFHSRAKRGMKMSDWTADTMTKTAPV